MTNFRKTVLAAATLLALGVSSQASALTISGITLGPGSSGNYALQDISAESLVTQVGDTLQGAGKITAIGGGSNFAAPGLELNFVYSAHVAFDNGSVIIFDTGTLTFYVNNAGTFNITSTSPYGSLAALQTALATGTEFANLKTTTVNTISPYLVSGAPATGGFFGTGTDLAGSSPNGSGVGYMSVVAGAGTANAALDTNAQMFNGTTPYDMLFTSTFSVPASGVYASWLQIQDASTFTGSYVSVPEPGSLALLGLGLAGVGLRRRKLNAVATATA